MPCALLFDADVPDDFLCPITFALMQEPVVAEDGYTYERAGIEGWCRTQEGAGQPVTSPISRAAIDPRRLVDNRALRHLIALYCEQTGEAVPARPRHQQRSASSNTPVDDLSRSLQTQAMGRAGTSGAAAAPRITATAQPPRSSNTVAGVAALFLDLFRRRQTPLFTRAELLDSFYGCLPVSPSVAGQHIKRATDQKQILKVHGRFWLPGPPIPLSAEEVDRLFEEILGQKGSALGWQKGSVVEKSTLLDAIELRFGVPRSVAGTIIHDAASREDHPLVEAGDDGFTFIRGPALTDDGHAQIHKTTAAPCGSSAPSVRTTTPAPTTSRPAPIPTFTFNILLLYNFLDLLGELFPPLQRTGGKAALKKAHLLDAMEEQFEISRSDAGNLIKLAFEQKRIAFNGQAFVFMGTAAATVVPIVDISDDSLRVFFLKIYMQARDHVVFAARMYDPSEPCDYFSEAPDIDAEPTVSMDELLEAIDEHFGLPLVQAEALIARAVTQSLLRNIGDDNFICNIC